MKQYCTSEEDIETLCTYFQAAINGEENKESLKRLLDLQCGVMRSHPYQSERDKVLNNKLASRYKALLVHCMDTIEDIRRKYTIAPKSCKSCSAYDLCEELRQKVGELQYQCGDDCQGECSGEVDGFVHCPYDPQTEQKTPDHPLNYATMAILARIGKQAEFKAAWERLENAERNYICGDIYNIVKSACSHPYRCERDKVLNNKLASRYKALLVQCMDTIEDIRRKYTIATKSCKSCSAYDLCEELRQAGEP